MSEIFFLRSVWQGMLLVGAFIEQVVVKMNMKDERIEAVTLKHCTQLHGVSLDVLFRCFFSKSKCKKTILWRISNRYFLQLMEGSPNLRSKDNLQQIIRILNDYHNESISRDLR